MNPNQLLTHFDRISQAPDAIPRLRRFILDLAVRGKLVEQDQEDEPASELLKRIHAEKARLVKKLEVRRSDGEQLDSDEVPFKLPENWTWTRLGEICSKTGSGITPRGGRSTYQDQGVPFFRSQNIYNDGLRLNDVAFIDKQTHQRMGGTVVKPTDLLLNITGGSMGRCCRVPDDFKEANISQHVAIIRVAILGIQDFLHLLILSPYFQSFIFDEQTGAGRGGLPKNKMDRIPIVLPPLAEQHRIVAKVDELMALCDQLEAAQTERESQRDRLVAATHTSLSNSTFHISNSKFFISHLPRLTTCPDHIKQLRQTILNLAVQGKLVPQNASDEPILEELRRLEDNISNLEFNRENEEPSGLGVRYLLPGKWAWLKGHRIANFIDPQPSHRTPPEYPNGIPYIGYADILNTGDVDFLNARKVSPTILEEHRKRYTLQTGDFVIGKIGTIGKPFLLPSPFNYTLSANIILLQPNKHLVSPSYLMAFINSPIAETALGMHKTDSTHAVFGIKKARELLIPVPPLAEQHRIVAKVDELMALCNQLETQLTTTQTETHNLLNSLLTETLAKQTEKN